MNVATLPPKDKLNYLRDCVLAIRAGGKNEILCPYCGEWNYPTSEFVCCKVFGEAMDAVVGRIEAIDNIDFVSNVHDRMVN